MSTVSFLVSSTAVSVRPLPPSAPFPWMPPITDLRRSLPSFTSCTAAKNNKHTKTRYTKGFVFVPKSCLLFCISCYLWLLIICFAHTYVHRGVFFFHSLIHEILLILLYFVLWLMIFVCTWCSCWYVLISFHSGLLLLFFAHTCHLVGGIVFFHLVAHAHRPIPTHIAIVLRWHASLHTEMLVGGGWCWLDDVQRFPPRRK